MCLCAWERKFILLCSAIWVVLVSSKNSLESLEESRECCIIVLKQAVQHCACAEPPYRTRSIRQDIKVFLPNVVVENGYLKIMYGSN